MYNVLPLSCSRKATYAEIRQQKIVAETHN